jgi:hypothetical protein
MQSQTEKALMREFVRPASAFGIAWLLASIAIGPNRDALAQAQQTAPTQQQAAPTQVAPPELPAVKQIALTEKQIKGLLAASKDIDAITDNAPEDIDKLSPKTIAQLDAVAKRNGLSSYAEYINVNENIGLVLGGVDPVTRKYVGKEAWVKAKIARVRADKKMSEDSKKEALQELYDNLEIPLPPTQYKTNIALVVRYLDKLNAAMRGD